MIWHENKPMIDYKNIKKQKGITIPHCKSMGIATRKTNCHKNGSVRKAGCNPWYNRVKTLSLPHEAMASITNRIP